MTYTAHDWQPGDHPMAAYLNNAETQYDEAVAVLNTVAGSDVTASRSLSVTYQNLTGKPLWVCVTTTVGSWSGIMAAIGASLTKGSEPHYPVTSVALNFFTAISALGGIVPITFLVPNGWYYEAIKYGSPTLQSWYEWTLH